MLGLSAVDVWPQISAHDCVWAEHQLIKVLQRCGEVQKASSFHGSWPLSHVDGQFVATPLFPRPRHYRGTPSARRPSLACIQTANIRVGTSKQRKCTTFPGQVFGALLEHRSPTVLWPRLSAWSCGSLALVFVQELFISPRMHYDRLLMPLLRCVPPAVSVRGVVCLRADAKSYTRLAEIILAPRAHQDRPRRVRTAHAGRSQAGAEGTVLSRATAWPLP